MDKKFFLIIILVLIIWFYFSCVSLKKFWFSEEDKETFYNGMETVDKVLKKENIPYFVICGTLLGIARNNEIIPWDDDMDLGILEKDIERYNKIDWSQYGFTQTKTSVNGCGKIYLKKHLYIDIFPFENIDGKWCYVEKKAKNIWPNEYFLNEELFPLKRYRFGKTCVNGPNKLIPYCERSWGNWKKGKPKLWKLLINPILLYKTCTYKMS